MGQSVHLIYTDESGGTLWQGGRLEIERLNEVHYDLVVMAANDYQPEILTPEQAAITPQEIFYFIEMGRIIVDIMPIIIRIPIGEPTSIEDFTEEMSLEEFKTVILDTAKQAATRVGSGQKVLSSCWGGVQRSSLISALTIKILRPEVMMIDIMDVLQEKRAFGLSNPYFPRILMQIAQDVFGD